MLGLVLLDCLVSPRVLPLWSPRVQGVLPVLFGAMRVVLPASDGGVVHLVVVYGYQGSEDSEKLSVTDELIGAVLGDSQVVCVGQPLLVVGDFNADPGVVPCLSKGISFGRFVDLALAYSVGAEGACSYL